MNNSFDNTQSDSADFSAREAYEAQLEIVSRRFAEDADQSADFDPARDTDMIHDIQQDTKWLMGGIVWRR